MKKATTLILFFGVLLSSLCGCMQNPPVEITTDNLEEYFIIQTTATNDFGLEDIELIRDDDSVERYSTAVPDDDDEDDNKDYSDDSI